jgi:hypothetical protein
MKAAVLEKPAASATLDSDRLRALVLVRIAGAPNGLTGATLAGELAPLASHRIAQPHWRPLIERATAALADAGLIHGVGARLEANDTGLARAALFLGLKGDLPRSWNELHDVWLVAKVLGIEREPPKRLRHLATPDGFKGVATPSRLRVALAAIALERAFGNQIKAGLSGKLGLSAKAGRLLAGQLARKRRDFGTDARLVTALAAEHVGSTRSDAGSLRLALLRRYLDAPAQPAPRRRAPAKPPATRPRLVEPAPAPAPVATGRPNLAGFADEVRRHALARAEGWPGNRKAYISHVWQQMREAHPEWGLSEIEFKCMLIEAHRAGNLALAHADLKDNSNIAQVQESAVVYKNAVFHFVRVDG